MNADKFTQKTIETIQTAQSMAQENGNQYLTPEHLLYALVDADGGLIGTLLGRMGVDCNAVLSELDTAIDQLPKVSGGSGEVYASPETSKIFNFAEREAEIRRRRLRLRRAPDARHLRQRDRRHQAHLQRPRHHEGWLRGGAEKGQDRAPSRATTRRIPMTR